MVCALLLLLAVAFYLPVESIATAASNSDEEVMPSLRVHRSSEYAATAAHLKTNIFDLIPTNDSFIPDAKQPTEVPPWEKDPPVSPKDSFIPDVKQTVPISDEWEVVKSETKPTQLKPRFITVVLEVILSLCGLLILSAVLVKLFVLLKRFANKLGSQKFILLCGLFLFVLCGLFPPWRDISHQGHTRAAAYSFILSPPATAGGSYGVEIDFSRLTVEWLCILAVTGVALIIFTQKNIKEPKQETNNPPTKV